MMVDIITLVFLTGVVLVSVPFFLTLFCLQEWENMCIVLFVCLLKV